MWKKLLDFGASVVQIGSLLLENQKQLKELQDQMGAVSTEMKLLSQSMDHFKEMERAHHHNNLLELENRVLQMERRLPPGQ
jgi:hypothetical protein